MGRIKAEEKRERRPRASGRACGRAGSRRARRRSGHDAGADPRPQAAGKGGKVGFDWDDVRGVVAKLREEIAEAEAEIAAGAREKLAAEIGDLLFAAVNLARFVEVDPEAALRAANRKFERRFSHIERRLAESGRRPEGADIDEMEALWREAKGLERDR